MAGNEVSRLLGQLFLKGRYALCAKRYAVNEVSYDRI